MPLFGKSSFISDKSFDNLELIFNQISVNVGSDNSDPPTSINTNYSISGNFKINNNIVNNEKYIEFIRSGVYSIDYVINTKYASYADYSKLLLSNINTFYQNGIWDITYLNKEFYNINNTLPFGGYNSINPLSKI